MCKELNMLPNNRKIIPASQYSFPRKQSQVDIKRKSTASYLGHSNGENDNINQYLLKFLKEQDETISDFGFVLIDSIKIINKALDTIHNLYGKMKENPKISYSDLTYTKQLLTNFAVFVKKCLEIEDENKMNSDLHEPFNISYSTLFKKYLVMHRRIISL